MAEIDGTKTCGRCREVKSLSLFHVQKNRPDGWAWSCKACRKEHRQKVRAADPEAAKRRDAEKHAKNRENRNAYNRRRRAEKPEEVQAYNREYVSKNLEYFRAKNAVRRMRIKQSADHYTAGDVQELLKLQRGKCACCKETLERYEVDHIKPLSKGGDNGRENIQLLCVHCNRTKHDKDPIEFMQDRGFLI